MTTESAADTPLSERLLIFYLRLNEIETRETPQETLAALGECLDEVEDEFTDIDKSPGSGFRFDGRMYPPRPDFTKVLADGSIEALTRGHVYRDRR